MEMRNVHGLLKTLACSVLALAVVAAVFVPYVLGYVGEGILVLEVGILAWLVRRQTRVAGIPWFAPGEVDRKGEGREG